MFCAHYYDERYTSFSIKDFFVVSNAISDETLKHRNKKSTK